MTTAKWSTTTDGDREIEMNAVPAEVFPAGEFLADELEARGWTQAEFAAILDRPAQFVSEIISGKKEITRESATQIGAALGTSAEMWLSLERGRRPIAVGQVVRGEGRQSGFVDSGLRPVED